MHPEALAVFNVLEACVRSVKYAITWEVAQSAVSKVRPHVNEHRSTDAPHRNLAELLFPISPTSHPQKCIWWGHS
ncbi:hypothetical protein RRG08_004474 [Elysia crispata]|uniref:Uncharacterized protein n=1 Tax=Elysia crispata TaxID=231223 RepID=A0AAE1EC53_9GAST|nr:hypothetical protein RRG08_004474 [Elysia crispata]